MVRLNRAVAVAEADGPHVGLAMLEGVEKLMDDSHRFYAVKADLERRAGHTSHAIESYNRAIELCTNEVEGSFLRNRLLEVETAIDEIA